MFNLTSYQTLTKRKEMLCFLSFIKLTNIKINDYFPKGPYILWGQGLCVFTCASSTANAGSVWPRVSPQQRIIKWIGWKKNDSSPCGRHWCSVDCICWSRFPREKNGSMHQMQSWSSLVSVKSRLTLLGYPKSVSWFQYPHFIKLMWLSIRHISADTTVEKN